MASPCYSEKHSMRRVTCRRTTRTTPPYLHDGHLGTLADTVDFFNLILGTQLTADEKKDLVGFLHAL